MENNGSEEVMVNHLQPSSSTRNKLPGGMVTSRNKKDSVDTSRMTSRKTIFYYYIL